jgi:hypothetical protein
MDPIDDPSPSWLEPFCAEIARELGRLARTQDDHRPALEQEAARLQASLEGWSISLAKPDLSAGLREDLERKYAQAWARLDTIRSELDAQHSQGARLQELVDPRKVRDRLRRLDEVLASGNVGRGNLELSRHIDRIDVHADGRVVMKTSKLGIFEGAAGLLAQPSSSAPPATAPAGAKRIRPRGRGPLRVDPPLGSGTGSLTELTTRADPGPCENLDPKWFWEDVFELPAQMCWAQEHAAEVARLRAEGWTMARLAQHFPPRASLGRPHGSQWRTESRNLSSARTWGSSPLLPGMGRSDAVRVEQDDALERTPVHGGGDRKQAQELLEPKAVGNRAMAGRSGSARSPFDRTLKLFMPKSVSWRVPVPRTGSGGFREYRLTVTWAPSIDGGPVVSQSGSA